MPPVFTFPPPDGEEPPQEEPPQEEKPPSRELTPIPPGETGVRFFTDLEFEFRGVTGSGKRQLATTFELSISFTTVILPGDLEIDEADFSAMDGVDLTLDLRAFRVFLRYDAGQADASGTVVSGDPRIGDSRIELEWDVDAWEFGIERPLLVGEWTDFSFEITAAAGYYLYRLDPTRAVEDNPGGPGPPPISPASVQLDADLERMSGFFFGIGARAEVRVYEQFYLDGAAEILFLTGDLRGEAVQLLIGVSLRF